MKPFLIVTGSSAGGIDALLSLVGGLPADFPVPIVIAQHLDPSHPSRLDTILAHRTALPVRFVAEREELASGGIYVVPAAHDVAIVDGAATTRVEVRPGPKPSVDRLFDSAAEAYGDGAIAIVFSGMGNDGLAGVRAVKERGGTVLIQDPRSASHPSMPLAIPPTLVDFVARPEEMGAILVDLIRRTRLVGDGSGDQNELRRLLTQLRDRSGIDFLQYKMPTITRRLSRLMVASGVSSIPEYVRYLQSHPDAYQKLVGAFLIKVTEFFRDAPLFEELKNHVLPELIDEAVRSGNELRIWSAGTSTGEEAYSLAILCAELLAEKNVTVGVRIFATDLDEEAIAFARRGVYGRETLRHIPSAWIERHFVRMGDQYEVAKRIRNMTVFGAHDLGQRAPFPRIDLCTCRNVLIYFTRELQTRALQLFAFSLRNGGYLVLGKAESTTLLSQYFRPVSEALKIYQREGDRILIPPTRIRDGVTLQEREQGISRAALAPPAFRPSEYRPSLNELIGSLVTSSGLGVIVINRRYDIISINAAARSLLDIHGVGIGEDLVHLVRNVDAGALRDVIDNAFHSEEQPSRLLPASDGTAERDRWLRVAVYADRQAMMSTMDAVVLIVTDVTTEVVAGRELEARAHERGAQVDQLSTRVDELAQRQRALLRANDELTSANAELRSVNEQLLINAEEAASANEEIETLNEEMQATNEELETLNEELQATVEELNTTNDELEVRGHDLERLGVTREGSMLQLEGTYRVLSAALRVVAAPFVLVDALGTVLFASDGLHAVASAAPEGWWAHGGSLSTDGRSLPYTSQDVLVEGQRYRVLTFADALEDASAGREGARQVE